MITNENLRRLFTRLNKKYFHNKLDSNIKVSFKSMRDLGEIKNIWFTRPATSRERHENNLNKTAVTCYWIPRIWISSKLRFSRRLSYETLVHEMVHAENMKLECSGPSWSRFNKRMLELAKQGIFNGIW